MSAHWSQDAQAKSGGDGDAGNPVHACPTRAKVIQVFDANEQTVVDAEVKTPDPLAPLEPESSVASDTPPLEPDLQIAPDET